MLPKLDIYSYLVGCAVAMSYMLVPRFEKLIDKIVFKLKNRKLQKSNNYVTK